MNPLHDKPIDKALSEALQHGPGWCECTNWADCNRLMRMLIRKYLEQKHLGDAP